VPHTTAAIVCQFAGGGIAQVTACWTTGPDDAALELHGPKASVHIDERAVWIRDRAGTAELLHQPRPANLLGPQIEEFLTTLQTSPAAHVNIARHLPTLAVLEAAYLPPTGQREPGPILDMHELSRPTRPADPD
jgi:hypothetical protein